jgi:hypothetical protein
MSSTAAPNLADLWLGVSELAAVVQGTWQAAAAAAGHGEPRPRLRQQQRKLGGDEKATTTAVQQRAAAAAAGDGDVGRCGGAMSDTTLYLLLDRFAPS